MIITKSKVILLFCLLVFTQIAIARPTIGFGQEFTSPWDITFDVITNVRQQRRFSNMIQREMAKYPDVYFDVIMLQSVLVVGNLQLDGRNIGGIALVGSGVIIVNTRNTLEQHGYVQNFVHNYYDSYIRQIFHHELHHYAEFVVLDDFENWEPWRNSIQGFTLAAMQAHQYNLTVEYNRNLLDFLTLYSTSHPMEDRATMVEFFMTNNQTRRQFINKAMRDDLFYQKALVLLTMLAEQLHFSEPLEVFLQRTARR